ncbi:unnamed protein product, partial [Aphanomyces euteiches]
RVRSQSDGLWHCSGDGRHPNHDGWHWHVPLDGAGSSPRWTLHGHGRHFQLWRDPGRVGRGGFALLGLAQRPRQSIHRCSDHGPCHRWATQAIVQPRVPSLVSRLGPSMPPNRSIGTTKRHASRIPNPFQATSIDV